MYKVHSALDLRARLRVASSARFALVIWIDNFDSAFSKEAGDVESLCCCQFHSRVHASEAHLPQPRHCCDGSAELDRRITGAMKERFSSYKTFQGRSSYEPHFTDLKRGLPAEMLVKTRNDVAFLHLQGRNDRQALHGPLNFLRTLVQQVFIRRRQVRSFLQTLHIFYYLSNIRTLLHKSEI